MKKVMKRFRVKFLIIFCIFYIQISAIFAAVEWIKANGVAIANNQDYAPTCLKLIEDSTSEILLMLYQVAYYDNYPGSDSNILFESLERALKRGVKVQAIIDLSEWNEENMRKNFGFGEKLFKEGAIIYFDSPAITSHQKVLIVDERYSVVASANWTHFSLKVNNEVGVVIDSPDFYSAIRKYFNSRLKEAYYYDGKQESTPCKIPPPAPTPPDSKPHPTPTEDQILKPLKKIDWIKVDGIKLIANRDYANTIIDVINRAKSNINIVQMESSYYQIPPFRDTPKAINKDESLSPTNDIYWALATAKKRNISIEVILDAQKDRENKNEDFANRLLVFDIDVFYDDPEVTTHAKMLTIDDELTVIGSTNWSFNALVEGNEVSVLIKSKKVAEKYNSYFKNLSKKSIKVKINTFSLVN